MSAASGCLCLLPAMVTKNCQISFLIIFYTFLSCGLLYLTLIHVLGQPCECLVFYLSGLVSDFYHRHEWFYSSFFLYEFEHKMIAPYSSLFCAFILSSLEILSLHYPIFHDFLALPTGLRPVTSISTAFLKNCSSCHHGQTIAVFFAAS